MTECIEVPQPLHQVAGGRSVSISEERDFVIPNTSRYEVESEAGDRKESVTSFLLPAVNLARRLSMKIAGNKDLSTVRRRKRRAPHNENKFNANARRKSIFDRRSSNRQMSIDLDRGIITFKEEEPNPLINIIHIGLRQLRALLGLQYSGVPETEPQEPETISLSNIDPPHRYRPLGIKHLCDQTGFSEAEMKRLYRGFKNECPAGVVDEEHFHNIYNNFFPWGEESYQPFICSYSHYIFSLLDEGDKGVITFEEFVLTIAQLYHGTEEQKLEWTFKLYDLNGDGYIQKDELQDVAISIFDLMGKTDTQDFKSDEVLDRIGEIFEDMDDDSDGFVSLDEFIEYSKSEGVVSSLETAISGFGL